MKSKLVVPKIFIAAIIVVLLSAGFVQPAHAQSTCGPTYVVQPGDWMAKIARYCGVSYSALLAANPQITTPWLIYPGQVLNMPGGIPNTGAALSISPTSGVAGTTLNVSGANFPANAVVRVGPAPNGAGGLITEKQVTADNTGAFNTSVAVPADAAVGAQFVVQAFVPGIGVDATSQVFTVTDSGSTNPSVTITPTSGPAGATVTVKGSNWAPGSTVRMGPARNNGSDIVSEVQAVVGAKGHFTSSVTIPSTAANGEQWVVRAFIPGIGTEATSNVFTVATSGTGGSYTVVRGDTMYKIAGRFGIPLNVLLAANPQIANPWLIYPGQVIYLPGNSGGIPDTGNPAYYTVQRGDTLRIIADKYGTTWQRIWGLNPQIWNPNIIYPGQVIQVS